MLQEILHSIVRESGNYNKVFEELDLNTDSILQVVMQNMQAYMQKVVPLDHYSGLDWKVLTDPAAMTSYCQKARVPKEEIENEGQFEFDNFRNDCRARKEVARLLEGSLVDELAAECKKIRARALK